MRTTLTLAALVLAALPLAAQQRFTVSGVAHPEAQRVLLYQTSGSNRPDTIAVEQGRFTATGEAPEGMLMVLVDRDHRMMGYFVADAEAISVDMNTDVMTGSPMNERLSDALHQLQKADEADAYVALAERLIRENHDNVVGAYVLSDSYYALGYATLKTLLETDSLLAAHPLAAQAKAHLKSLELRAPGRQFTDLEEPDAEGVAHKLSEYVGRGQWVLVDFWASWCGPCRQEMPNVVAAYERYHDRGFQVVGLSFDSNREAWLKAITDLKMPWIHLSDLKGWRTTAAEVYGIRSIPASILVDPQGKIAAVDLRGAALKAKLAEIYGE